MDLAALEGHLVVSPRMATIPALLNAVQITQLLTFGSSSFNHPGL
jgi:hypothetical protein